MLLNYFFTVHMHYFSGTGSDDKDSDSELLTSPFANSFTTLQELMKHHKESLGLFGIERIQISRQHL